jgi:hypothetical protein
VRYSIHAGLQVELSASVREHHIQVRLAPWEDECQQLDECILEAEPRAEPILHRDGFGNPLHSQRRKTTMPAAPTPLTC